MGPLVPTGADLDRETLLDITVNLIPMGILLFFIGLSLVYSPFPPSLFMSGMSHLLTVVPLVLLALLTYVAAKVIARDERQLEARSSTDDRPATLDDTATGEGATGDDADPSGDRE
ncbi:DUF6684 family protein [Halomarina rubra]|uniref:DUF6684 family protein n=1 Tax=Halomarina rubra TaxID=2071873 RepID=A0ABD6ASR4_9EURY|nr:DUF6684 family protein [Halomarina rubra]